MFSLFKTPCLRIICILTVSLPWHCMADSAAMINETAVGSIVDINFRQCVQKLMVKNQWQAAEQVESIKCHNMEIASAEGLENFINIRQLSLYQNQLKSIDISRLEKLETINLASNQLQFLKLSNLPKLTKLFVFKNQLVELRFTDLPELTQVKANNNALNLLTLHSTPKLTKLYLFNNQLEHLEIKHQPQLRYIDVRQNPMPDEFYDFLDEQSDLTARHDGNADDWG
jgi:protein phosphatase 1 regulatory subunit 7